MILHTQTNLSVDYVKPTTKKGEWFLYLYNKATKSDILNAYKKPSKRKISSFEAIKEEMEEANGKDLRITASNCNSYSCGYLVKDFNGNTYLIYHTPVNRYAILYNEGK